MPMPCYLVVATQDGTAIEGSGKVKGHENKILVQAVDHTIEIPRNPQTGLPSGQRVHQPMTVTKEIDKATPMLLQALTSGQQLTVGLEYYRINAEGKEELYYKVGLKNAILTSVRAWTPNCLVAENKQMGHMENLSFTYAEITWTAVTDKIEAGDKWSEPKQA